MNLFDRFILSIYSLALLVISAFAIGVFSNLINESMVQSFFAQIYTPSTFNIPYLIVAVLFFIISLRFFFSSFSRRNNKESKAIYQRMDLGHVSISYETIRSIAEKSARRVKGVIGLKTEVKATEAGSVIILRLTVDGDTPIPELTQTLQYEVKEVVERIVGIDVTEVVVHVTEVAPSEIQAIRTRRVE